VTNTVLEIQFCHASHGSDNSAVTKPDIRALWRSELRARVPECQKLKT